MSDTEVLKMTIDFLKSMISRYKGFYYDACFDTLKMHYQDILQTYEQVYDFIFEVKALKADEVSDDKQRT